MLDLVAETSERRKTELAIDAIVKRVAEGLVCNVTSFEQHNSNERAASLSDEIDRQDSWGSSVTISRVQV
jgi:hypothetical protein